MNSIPEILAQYKEVKEEIERLERVKQLLNMAYKNYKKIQALTESEKYGDLVTFEHCAEKPSRGTVPLAFCLTKCVIKCRDFKFVKKHNPNLISYVERLNETHFKIVDRIRELKRV